MNMNEYRLVIHGGAGTILPSDLNEEKERAYTTALQNALMVGEAVLQQNGSAIEAVTASVASLEDCPLFNAGRGAVYTNSGTHEMDAAIMEGKDLKAGAVGLISGVRNPVRLARMVMEESEHVFLCGTGAENFARLKKLSFEPESYFADAYRLRQLLAAQERDVVQLDHTSEKKYGTVGAVALDRAGNVAAATSTGGVTNKKFGRIGDSPLIGAGTYANNATCAVSCTGYGEDFIRGVVAYDLSCLMEYRGMPLGEAAQFLIQEKLPLLNGDGGLIAVAANGDIALEFNSEGMYRGWVAEGKGQQTAIFRR
jgi:beta-aspartyl-peptidase (threonine type)